MSFEEILFNKCNGDDIKGAEVFIKLLQYFIERIDAAQKILYDLEKTIEDECKSSQAILNLVKKYQENQKETRS